MDFQKKPPLPYIIYLNYLLWVIYLYYFRCRFCAGNVQVLSWQCAFFLILGAVIE